MHAQRRLSIPSDDDLEIDSNQLLNPVVNPPTWIATMEPPRVVDNFLANEWFLDHYEPLAACAEHLIGEALAKQDMQPWKTTSRAKTEDSLREKLTVRYEEKKYANGDEIKRDIVDLAGVRVILYMPTEKEEEKVKNAIQSIWGRDVKPKLHPEPKKRETVEDAKKMRKKKYQPRHLGYRAIHYRAEMKPHQSGMHGHVKYHWKPLDMVEIQVVSALTHAWAEVGHDVLYKSYAYGQPTVQEERALDALNGLVQSGELLLQQFHEMVHKRTHTRWKHRDEFEAYLREADILQDLKKPLHFESDGLEVLLGFLIRQDKNYPIAVRTALKQLGFPENPQLEHNIAYFQPAVEPIEGMVTVLCLTHHLLRSQPYQPPRTELTSSKQCCIMMNALHFIQRIFGPVESAYEYLRALPMTPEEKKSMDFVLASDKRQVFLLDSEDQERDKPSLKSAWTWFQKQARNPKSICGLAFRLAEMGCMRDVNVYTLLESLTIGQYGSLSRCSTTSMDDDGDSSRE
jgi:ppGpp synthetase/RelA/SpoT-type nucleotidyltranferase